MNEYAYCSTMQGGAFFMGKPEIERNALPGKGLTVQVGWCNISNFH
jgi:hypothetical protein